MSLHEIFGINAECVQSIRKKIREKNIGSGEQLGKACFFLDQILNRYFQRFYSD